MTTWSIVECEDYLVGPAGPYEGDPRVSYTIHWQCVEVGGPSLSDGLARRYGSASLEPFGGGEFVPWDTVTEEMALGWLHDKMGAEEVARIEAHVTVMREISENPTTGRGIPWTL